MDWIDEKMEKILQYIKNLSFRRAMIAYILVLAAVVWGLSYITMAMCWHWESVYWAQSGEVRDLRNLIYEKGLTWGYSYSFSSSEAKWSLIFLDVMRVWCPFIYAFIGMIVAILIFYKKRLERPFFILKESMEQVRENNLDFHVSYESRDEFGSLCDSFEEMRLELVRGKTQMWNLIERQKELNTAFAHDLRTPLTVLRGYTDFLARYIPEGRVSEEKMQDTLKLMSAHLKRLEDYSRTMKGIRSIEEVPVTVEETELDSVQQKIREIIFALNQVGDIEIQYTECARQQRVWIDENILIEVLENVLSNAIRYAKEKIVVSADYNEKNGELILTVRDDGSGFSSTQLKRATKPYYKEYDASCQDEHFGIGLHICRELCKRHGGTLDVANSVLGGAVVTASFSTENI